ncbi:hypothetical protein RRG08_059398 [Elysia crispata]|uniref:Uncharacterized protein n=1 Tax=Elysia crispata TaxID=231223 RepID=A0AAE1DVL6_9GAST|nr:hypothetical protein RRG08_059398 [Elysia crispata]
MDGAGVERDNTSSASRLWMEQELSRYELVMPSGQHDLTFPPFSPLSHLTVGAASRHFPPSVDFLCNSASPKAVALPSQLIFSPFLPRWSPKSSG